MPANYYIHNMYANINKPDLNSLYGEAQIKRQQEYLQNQMSSIISQFQQQIQEKFNITVNFQQVLEQLETFVNAGAENMVSDFKEINKFGFTDALENASAAMAAKDMNKVIAELEKAQKILDNIEESFDSYERSYEMLSHNGSASRAAKQVYIENYSHLNQQHKKLIEENSKYDKLNALRKYLTPEGFSKHFSQQDLKNYRQMLSNATSGIMSAAGFMSEGLMVNALGKILSQFNKNSNLKIGVSGSGAASGYFTNTEGQKLGYKNKTEDVALTLQDTTGEIRVKLPGITLKRTGNYSIVNGDPVYTVHVKTSSVGQVLDTAQVNSMAIEHFYNYYANSGRNTPVVINNDGTIGEHKMQGPWNLTQAYKFIYTSMILSSMSGNLTTEDFAYFLVINDQVYTMPEIVNSVISGSALFGESNFPKSFIDYIRNPEKSVLARRQQEIVQKHNEIFERILKSSKYSMEEQGLQRSREIMKLMYNTQAMPASLALQIPLKKLARG